MCCLISSVQFLTGHFPNIDKEKDIDIFYNISTSSSPGKVNVNGQEADVRKYMFKPRGIYDLKELTYLGSNDTSIGASYAPFSATERIVLEICVPARYCGNFYGPFKKFGSIKKEYYDNEGSFRIHIEITESQQDRVIDYIKKNSNNEASYHVSKS